MSEFSENFLTKRTEETSNKILVELTLNGDVDKSLKTVFLAFKQENEILPGVSINQIYFKGYDINKIVHQKRKELVEGIQEDVTKLLEDLKQ
jgi:hypothetical protein